MKKFRLFTYIVLIILFSTPIIGAQLGNQSTENKIVQFDDSISIARDTTLPRNKGSINSPQDSVVQDSIVRKKNALDAPVEYSANDSIIFTIGSWAFLYGDSKVDYKEIALKAENIAMNMDSSIVSAKFGLDSIGKEFGHPVFSDGGTEYESKTMRYNFKTKKGYITNVITEQGEGYIVAEKAKKNEDESFFMCNGKYTTCDNHDHPHFYFMLTKAKVRPKKNVVTGPAYLVVEDLPLPIALPFGFFPFTDKYSSGIIMPSYGDELDRGFNLRDGGYYFAINDNVDLALTGEIYTKGSWGLNARSTYRKRYKYSGGFNISYLYTKLGERGMADFSESKDFGINWNHSQDPKSNMFRTLSASVDFKTASYNRNSLTGLGNPDLHTAGTKSSTITLTQRFPNSPFTLNANITANQTTRDSMVSLTLPNLTVNMSRISPFKRKNGIGEERWYEKIQFSYAGEFRNSIRTKETELFNSNLVKDWQNAARHNIPVTATFSLLKNLNITPNFNYTERWYTNKIYKRWENNEIAYDTVYGFNRVYDFNYGASLQTRLFGFYEPLFKIGKIQKIRHVFTPSIGFSGSPDFSNPHFGFYETLYSYDANGNLNSELYSPFRNGIFGTPGAGKQGNITFDFQNNLEMKVATANDSTKIISLIDNLGINFHHNLMADSLKWSDINTTVRLRPTNNLMINVSAVFDPYTYVSDGKGGGIRVDQLRIHRYGSIARLKSTGYAISPSINQDTFKKWFSKDKKTDKKDVSKTNDALDPADDDLESKPRKSLLSKDNDDSSGDYDNNGYLKNEVKWNLAFNYSMQYNYSNVFNEQTNEFKGKITQNLGISGSIQPTKNWNFTFTTNYDFDHKEFAYMNCTLTRNLHCWSISAQFIPIGPYSMYYVSIRANSSMLQDAKYEQRSRAASYDPSWY